jgi:4'-phosphopantetheinyl transferase
MRLTCRSQLARNWMPAPTDQAPSCGTHVLVYRVAITENRHHAPNLWTLLAAAEQQRAHRYHFEADYYRFVISRAALRLVLGSCLGQPAAALRFEVGENKKPRLLTVPALSYNVSHAGNWVLLALACTEVGVDIEQLNPRFAFQDVLEHSCSPGEQEFVARNVLPHHAFYELWTRKESLVKATGQGINAAFSQVPALDGVHELPGPRLGAGWIVSSFAPAPDYVAAVAYAASPGCSLQFYDLGSEQVALLLKSRF